MKSHLTVILAQRLVGNMRYSRNHAQIIFSQQYNFQNIKCISTQEHWLSPTFHRYISFHHSEVHLRADAKYDSNTPKLWIYSDDHPFEFAVGTLKGHTRNVNSIVFHPTELFLATSSYDETAKLWKISSDYSSVKCVSTLVSHKSSVQSVAFHPKKPIIATGSSDMTIKLWKMSSDYSSVNFVVTLVSHTSCIQSIAFHPSSYLLATGGGVDNIAKLWYISPDISSTICISTLKHNDSVNYVEFNSKEASLTTISYAKIANIWK